MRTSVLRRYTPPTCTLEIMATRSPLSFWTDHLLLNNLKFRLNFDDPRQLDEEHITLEGNRAQLETLCEVVSQYVQQYLELEAEGGQSPFLGEASRDAIAPASQTLRADGHAPLPEADYFTPESSRNRFLPRPYHPAERHGAIATPPATPLQPLSKNTIRLQRQGLVSHTLWLGSLANETSGETVKLSTLQLFDLANALDAYATEATALPETEAESTRQPVAWGRIAAMLLVTVGVAATLTRLVLSPSTLTTQGETAAESESPIDTAIAPTAEPDPTASLPSFPEVGELPEPGSRAVRPNQSPRQPRNNGGQPPSTSNAPGQPPTRIPALPDLAPVAPGDRATNPSITAEAPPPAAQPEARLPEADAPASLSAPSADGAAPAAPVLPEDTTAFDAVPQVAEVRGYLQQRWSPTPELTQTLEYRLRIGADGSLQDIIPLGQVSRLNLGRTGIPELGTVFVSPLSSGQSAVIRVVLNREGRVQTFLEQLN